MKNHKIFIFNAPSSSRGIILPGRRLSNTFYKPKPIFIAGSNIKTPLGLPPIRPVIIKRMKIKRTSSTNNFKNDFNENNYSDKLCKNKLDCKTERKLNKKKEVDNNSYIKCFNNNNKNIFEKKQNKKKKINKILKKSNSVIENIYFNNSKYAEKKEKNEIITKEKHNENKEENKENLEIEDKEMLNKEIDVIVNYLLNLNYEKYNHDMEIREALELIRSKMNKEKEDNNKINSNDVKNKDKNENEEDENNEEKEKDNNNNDNQEKNNLIITNENNYELNAIEDKEEEKKKEEIEKYKLAEIISKHKMLKNVHSIKSIRKLLQRQGLDDPNLIDKSKIENQNEINE